MDIFKSKIDRAKDDLTVLGTKQTRHTRGQSLYHHLVRVQEILASWDCSLEVQLAGLYHSLYTTEYFSKHILNPEERDVLQNKIGNLAENIVHLFSKIQRESLSYSTEKNIFTFKNYGADETITCSYDEGIAILHIMLANDIDRIGVIGVGLQLEGYKKYTAHRNLLNAKAQRALNTLTYPSKDKGQESSKTFIRFIAHSGVQIADDSVSVVIDPWLYDSNRESPIIEGFDPTQRTIDYLLPEPKNTILELAPNIICLSHFHTHHSPYREIIECVKIKTVTIVCPPLTEDKLTTLRQKMGDYMFNRITFNFINTDTTLEIDGVRIDVFPHKKEVLHLAFHIQFNKKSLIHIVDASYTDNWDRIYDTQPDFLFIGAAGHIEKRVVAGVRTLEEQATLTPTQAAKLTARILPQYAGIIGIYNHSVWDDRYEMGSSVADAEAQFYWGLSYLAPSIKVKKLLPGDTF